MRHSNRGSCCSGAHVGRARGLPGAPLPAPAGDAAPRRDAQGRSRAGRPRSARRAHDHRGRRQGGRLARRGAARGVPRQHGRRGRPRRDRAAASRTSRCSSPSWRPRTAAAGCRSPSTKGMRALSVRVDEVISVAGFVVPGTRVDVLLTMDDPGGCQRADHQGHPAERAGPGRRPVGREGQGRQAAAGRRAHRAGDARSRPSRWPSPPIRARSSSRSGTPSTRSTSRPTAPGARLFAHGGSRSGPRRAAQPRSARRHAHAAIRRDGDRGLQRRRAHAAQVLMPTLRADPTLWELRDCTSASAATRPPDRRRLAGCWPWSLLLSPAARRAARRPPAGAGRLGLQGRLASWSITQTPLQRFSIGDPGGRRSGRGVADRSPGQRQDPRHDHARAVGQRRCPQALLGRGDRRRARPRALPAAGCCRTSRST